MSSFQQGTGHDEFARTTYIPKHCVVAEEIEACRVNLFRFREYLNGFTRSSVEPRVPLDSKPIHGTTDELVVLNRGGMVAPESEQINSSLV